jgi:hypothetical protein
VKKGVEDFLQAHINFAVDDKDDLSQVEITKKLTSNAGAHKPSGYEVSFDSTPIIDLLTNTTIVLNYLPLDIMSLY